MAWTLTAQHVLMYLPCKTYDRWVPAGTKATTCSEGFQVSNGHVIVSPLDIPPYSHLWLWVNKGITSSTTHVKVTASGPHAGGIAVTTDGVLYAPSAQVKVVGLGTQTTVGAIVASTFDVSNSTITVQGFG
jgi:hypothetical protein